MKKKATSGKSLSAKNSFVIAVFGIFTANPYRAFNFRQVSTQLGVTDKAEKELVKKILDDLRIRGEINELNRGKYQLATLLAKSSIPENIVIGSVDMKQTGKAYIIVPELDEDVFVASNNTYQAFHGDQVKVHLFPRRKGRKLEGEIVEIIKREKTRFVGTVHMSGKLAFVVVDTVSVPVDILVLPENLKDAKNGQKVVVKLLDWPEHSRNPFGEITDILGTPGDNEVEMKSILVNHDFPLKFPELVLKEAEKINETITSDEISRRRDFRNIWTITIDPEDAKDFDDALSLRKLANGLFEVAVHIADVSHYVQPGSVIDKEAYERGTSIYLVDRTIPMLPEKLSNYLCSLRPNEDKLCYAAVFILDVNANIKDVWYGKTIIRSCRRYNYEEVQKLIEGEEDENKESIMVLHQLAQKLRSYRYKNGSINFKSVEVKFNLDDKGKPLSTYIKENKESNWLIEEFMLLANRKVAEFIGKPNGHSKPKTFVYRIHDVPNPEKLLRFTEFIQKLGYRLNLGSRNKIAQSFNNLFNQISGKGEETMIETIAIRTMAKAEYSTNNIGHYGLNFNHYTHFTSPIRRYPDLIVHRMLDHYLASKPSLNADEYEQICKHSSAMEKKAAEAERDSVKYKQAEFLLDKIGKEFYGLISGVSKWGIFVELEGNKCEGMVSLKYMNDDFYYLDDDNYRVVGQRYGNEFRLGDRVKIIVKKVDLLKKQMDFVLAENTLKKDKKSE